MRTSSIKYVLLALAVALTSVAKADIQEVYIDSLTKMKEKDWQGSLDILKPFVEGKTSDKALAEFGPKFGWFWYHRGYCEAKLNKHEDAIDSFEKCYVDFPNAPGAKNKNTFQDYSLFKWAESSFAIEDYPLAKDKYLKFLKERDKENAQNDKFAKGKFYVNLAVCHFKTEQIDDGLNALQTAIKNKNKFLTPPHSVFTGFDALTEAAIKQNKERAILDFLRAYRSDLVTDIFVTSQYSKLILARASEAINAKMKVAPLELLSLVPNTETAINDLKAQLKSFEGFNSPNPIRDGFIILSPPRIKDLVKRLEDEARGKEPNEALKLALSAYLWSSSGNNRAAYAAYKQLESRYPKSKNREDNLFNLVRTCQNIGRANEAEDFGRTFLRSFPASDRSDAIKKMMLTGLYFDKQYDECIRVANGQLTDLEDSKPSEAHDLCLYVLGGSHYYTGKFTEAAEFLSQHVATYPESKFKDEVMFMEASTYSRLQQWSEAGKKLDAYLAKFKDTPSHLYPYALFDRANCHYSLQEYEGSLEKLGIIEEKYLSAGITDAAFNLKGNILQSQEDLERAEAYYIRAFDLASSKGNKPTAGEALNYLVMMLADPERKGEDRAKDAISYYDKYWQAFSEGSPFQAQVAVAGFPAMKKVGRSDEGLKRMEDVIAKVAKLPGQPMLEQLINSYKESYLEVNSVAQLKDHFYTFKGIDTEDKEAQALLRIALIGAYEGEIKTATNQKDEQKALTLNAQVKALFADLKNEFNPAILTPYSLIKIGDYIRNKTAAPRESIPYYEEILNRGNEEFKFKSMFGLADLYGSSTQVVEQTKAKTFLLEIYASESTRKATRESALYRLIQLHLANEEWAEANKRSFEYLDQKKFSKFRSKAGFHYAVTFDKQGIKDKALSAYVKVNGANLGNIPISAPSTKRIMELFWERNTPQKVEGESITISTRQAAYNQGWNYIDATSRLLTKMTDEEKALWNETAALVKQYEASGEIVDMATQKEQKAK